MKKQDLTEGAIQAKLQADREARAAEYKQKKESGAYGYEAQEHDLTFRAKQMATVVCKISKRADENLRDMKAMTVIDKAKELIEEI